MSKAPIERGQPSPDELHELATEDKSAPATQRDPSKKHQTLGKPASKPSESQKRQPKQNSN